MLAYFVKKSKIGDHFAKYSEKKYSQPNTVSHTQILYLFKTIFFFFDLYFLFAKTINL